jgi:hypothetical protein
VGGGVGGGGIQAAARGARQAAMEAQVAGAHPGARMSELEALVQPVEKFSAGGACTGMPLEYANRALPVLIRSG